MKSVNNSVRKCGIIPFNAAGVQLGNCKAHFFRRRSGAQHLFVTDRVRWQFFVVKWWFYWGSVDDMNTIVRYLLEETSTYENTYTHYLHTRRSDACMFNGNDSTNEDLRRELCSLQSAMLTRFSQMDKINEAHRLLVSDEMKKRMIISSLSLNKNRQNLNVSALLGKRSKSSEV